MAWTWELAAEYAEEVYGIQVDEEEEFFICPDCGEPIYKCDWTDSDFMICPICDFNIETSGYEYEEEDEDYFYDEDEEELDD